MATRSAIYMQNEDGTDTCIYCHWDGYPSHNGRILREHYQDRVKVEKLFSLGNLSVLGEEIDPNPDLEHNFDNWQEGVCLFYGRDRGDKGEEAIILQKKDICPYGGIEYEYVYTLDGKWICYGDEEED